MHLSSVQWNWLVYIQLTKRRISTYCLSAVPCELWFLQAGRYVTKGEKLLRAIVCFFIEHARPRDAYVKTSNDITFVCFARNNSKTTTLYVQSHLFLHISLPFLYDYDVKMPNIVFNGICSF